MWCLKKYDEGLEICAGVSFIVNMKASLQLYEKQNSDIGVKDFIIFSEDLQSCVL